MTVAAMAVLGMSTTGCASQESSSDIVEYRQLDELYDREVSTFPWELPDGVTFPETVPVRDVEGTLFQANNARAAAFFFWECSWMEVFFDNQNADPAQAAMAIDAIRQSVGNSYKDSFYDDSEGVWAQIVEDAALGDVSQFRSFYTSGCSAF